MFHFAAACLDSEFLWQLFLVVTANQKCSLWAIFKPIRLRGNLYTMLALSLCHDHEHFNDIDIVVKNKLNVVLPFVVDSLSSAS